MARYKNDPANDDYNAGDLFDYEVWRADTELTLCNVRFDAIYKDVWQPQSTQALNDWIDARGDATTITNAMYARIDEPIRIEMPLGRAQRYNYIRVFNPAQPVDGDDLPKYYYYFIRNVRHIAPNTTEIVVQLDVWMTYIRQINLGRAYIVRGHAGMANELAFRNYGRDFLSIPEALDTGSSYMNVATKRHKIMSTNPTYVNAGNGFSILAVSTVDLHGDLGNRTDPKNPSAKPSYVSGGIPSGAGIYLWESASEFMAFMADFSTKPWATSGISSITLIPDVRRYLGPGQSLGTKNATTRSYTAGFTPIYNRRTIFPEWRTSPEILDYIPERYRHLQKFLTSPYCKIELTLNNGNAVVLNPESWNSRDGAFIDMISLLPPNQRLTVIPVGYNSRTRVPNGGRYVGPGSNATNEIEMQGDALDMALVMSGFPTIPIVNNGQIGYLAANARSIQQQYGSANWAQTKALVGNQMSYDMATASVDAGSALTANSISGDQAQTAIQMDLAAQSALANLFTGTAMGAGMGAFAGPAGAVTGGLGGAGAGVAGLFQQGMQADAANKSLAARTSGANTANDITGGTGRYMRDANRAMADYAAKGDYANARAQIDARIQDTEMIPHGMSGQFGGEMFNLANDQVDFTAKFKMIDQAAIATLGEYWLRYGYPVSRQSLIPNDLRVMTHFSYWQLSEVYILNGNMPEDHKQAIRGILEKGVTVWNNPDDIGVIDPAVNRPLPGFTLEGYVPPPWTPEPDPEPPVITKRKKKKMLVYMTVDGTPKYALAGTAPGTEANWIETESAALRDQFLDACGVEAPVSLEIGMFYELRDKYLSPIVTAVEVVEV